VNYNNERNDSVTLTHESSSSNGLRTAEKIRNNAVNQRHTNNRGIKILQFE